MQNSHHSVIFLLTATYLVWLLAVLLLFGYTPTNDGVGYVELASQCLAQGQPYPTAGIFTTEPFVWNIGIICLTQLSLLLAGSLWPLLVLLCVLKAATALFTALAARRLFGPTAGIAALVLFALYPNNWGQSTAVSSEIPSTCLCMAAVWLAVRSSERAASSQTAPMLLAGFLLGLAGWFRPTAPIFMASLLVFAAFLGRRAFFRSMAGLFSGYALFVLVAGGSCYLRTGRFLYQARTYWFSMVDECYDGAAVSPHWGQPLWPEGTPRYIAPEERKDMDCFDYERIWRERSLDWLKDHQAEYLSKVPGRFFYMYMGDFDHLAAFLPDKSLPENNFITLPYRHLFSQLTELSLAQWLALLCLLCYAAVLLLAVIGAVRLVRRRDVGVVLPLMVVVGGTLMLIVLMHGETRFKDPLMPSVFILAAAASSPHLLTCRWTRHAATR